MGETLPQRSPEDQLSSFMARYEPAIEAAARDARARLQALLPGALELVYDNYNALVIAYGPTERASQAILSLVLMPRWLLLYFVQGRHMDDPDGLLQGSGTQGANIRLSAPSDLELPAVRRLIEQAVARAQPPLDPAQPRRLIIRSISEKQRPRRPR